MSTIVLARKSFNASSIPSPNNLGMNPPKSPYPYTAKSPILDAPDSSVPFLPNGSVVIPSEGATAIICQYTIPANYSGVIWAIANASNFGPGMPATWVPGSGALIWQLLRNGTPYQFFPNITTIVGLTELGGGKLAGPLRFTAGDIVALQIKNVSISPGGQVLVGLLNGYIYPQAQDPAGSR